MDFEEGDLVFWNYGNCSMVVIVVAGLPTRLVQADPNKIIGGFELETENPVYFYSNETTMVYKNVVDKGYEIRNVEQSKVILRNDETLITLQDLLIEGKLIGHKVLLGDTQKWILA